MVERPPPNTIPDAPGSYQFLDKNGRVLYVGKAKSLRHRLANYFADPRRLPDKTRQLVKTAATVQWVEVNSEVEALHLEYNLIKSHQPPFNIRLRDDKSFPYLAITTDHEWPRAMVMRGKKRKGVRYFGPYAHAYAIRETLDLLLRTFPVRTCTDSKLNRHKAEGRPCLFAHIEKCCAPCVDDVTHEQYEVLVGELISFLEGDNTDILDSLESRMLGAAEDCDFEAAARLRDQLASVRRAVERHEMVGPVVEHYDLIGRVDDPLESSVQVFHVRKGRLVGQKQMVIDRVEEVDEPALSSRLVEQIYGDSDPEEIPREILIRPLPDEQELLEEFLSEVRNAKVTIREPKRGGKRTLMETAEHNAKEALVRHRLRRNADHNARAKALTELQDYLGMDTPPLRIEGYDISNLQGTEVVASMVVMEDGLPKRPDYRNFTIKTVIGQDDFASMAEVMRRRLKRLFAERDQPIEQRRRFSYPPDLIVIDGGKGQLSSAYAVLEEFGLEEEITMVSLAKKLEEVYTPGRSQPLRIPRDSEALFLLQHLRDEAHRVAITHHRRRRDKAMRKGALDDIPGLGEKRKAKLIREFGSVKRLREADPQDIVSLPWLPAGVAAAVLERLHPDRDVAADGSVNTTAPDTTTSPTGGHDGD